MSEDTAQLLAKVSWVPDGQNEDHIFISPLMVCRSAAGYYVGRKCIDAEFPFEDNWSRNSGYYRASADAEAYLNLGSSE